MSLTRHISFFVLYQIETLTGVIFNTPNEFIEQVTKVRTFTSLKYVFNMKLICILTMA